MLLFQGDIKTYYLLQADGTVLFRSNSLSAVRLPQLRIKWEEEKYYLNYFFVFFVVFLNFHKNLEMQIYFFYFFNVGSSTDREGRVKLQAFQFVGDT